MTLFRCADDAEGRRESLAGTASQANRFVLIEYPSPWPKKAVEVFSGDLESDLVKAAAEASAKLLLVRRPGERTPDVRRWAVYDARARLCRWGTWTSPSDLTDLTAILGEEPAEDWTADPVVLVCTHARHDACCGVRGRPVIGAVADQPVPVWESTHVGGHRFAANLVLPLDGTYYGRVEAGDAAALIQAHVGDSLVSAEHLRGFSWMDPAAQAVAVEAHRRFGPAGADDVVDVVCERLDKDRWRVELTGGDVLPSLITAEVERVVGPEARMSCLADPMPTESFVIRTLDFSSQ